MLHATTGSTPASPRSTTSPRTLAHVLRRRASEEPEATAYGFVEDDGTERHITYGQLDRGARAVARALLDRGLAGERALLLYPPGLDYVIGLFGAFYAGVVAVPAYPPDPARLDRTLPRLRAIVADADPRAVLGSSLIAMAGASIPDAPDLARLAWIATDVLDPEAARGFEPGAPGGDALALLQYTSGSTRDPRGVVLRHGHLMANIDAYLGQLRWEGPIAPVMWLPVYHDMGLVGGLLSSMAAGWPCTFMSPITFLRRPLTWLRTISGKGDSYTGAPSFAFDLCARKITDAERDTLDLSRLRVVCTGAEPLRKEALDRFAERFGPVGFRPEALVPCYGLAESVLFVSGGTRGSLSSLRVDAEALERGTVRAAGGASRRPRTLIAHGSGAPGHQIAVVHPEARTRALPGEVGEIWVAGPSVGDGYLGRDAETAHVFRATIAGEPGTTFLRTGDLGFLHEGQLFITGRLKDLVVVRGRNVHPEDVEAAIEGCHPALRPGCAAVFSVEPATGEELCVVVEVDDRAAAFEEVFAAIQEAMTTREDLVPEAIVLVRARTIAKTSSGKIQRGKVRADFLSQGLEVVRTWRRGPAAGPDEPRPAAPPDHDPASVESWIQQRLAAELGVTVALPLDRPMATFGIDSVVQVSLVCDLEDWLGITLQPSLALRNATIADVARHVSAEASSQRASRP